MSRRPLTDCGGVRIRGSSQSFETIEARRMPLVGGRRSNPLAAKVSFWRNFALVLLICTAVRVAIDLYRIAH